MLMVKGNEERRRRICEVWNNGQPVMTMIARHDLDCLSRGPSTMPRFDRFSVIRILLLLSFVFITNCSKKLIFGVTL